MGKKLETFEVELNGKKVKLAVVQVDAEIGRKALQEYNRAFSSAIKSGAPLRSTLSAVMRDQKLWDDQREQEYQKLVKQLTENNEKIHKGGIKLQQAKKLALDMRDVRTQLRSLMAERTALDVNSAEGQAENARFNAIVSYCTVYDDSGEPYFKGVDDYLNRASEDVAVQAARTLGSVLFGLDTDYEKNLPENKFLRKWKFVNDDLQLVDKDGRLVDDEGRLINEEGRYIDENGNFVDRDGNPVTEEGELKVEQSPFLDDDGNPLSDPE